jgi:signal transduction histidine kinase
MSGIGSRLRSNWVEIGWGVFALANLRWMLYLADNWATVPFHFIWVSLALVYGRRTWRPRTTAIVLGAVFFGTGYALWTCRTELAEMTEIPLMSAMFLAMVWHARRRQGALEALRLASERERDFLRDASHSLRTPITVARGHVELMRADDPQGPLGADADVVLEELDNLAGISDRLLTLAAADHPDFVWREPQPVGDLVGRLEARWRPAAPRDWRVAAEARGTVAVDRPRLEAALDAVVENAVQHTAEGAPIRIAARAAPGGRLRIEVADGGSGIPPEELPRVFDRFWRGEDRGRRGRRGTGLGLAIVRAIVEAHEGSVAIRSAPGRGTTVTLELPGFVPDGRRTGSAGALAPAPS